MYEEILNDVTINYLGEDIDRLDTHDSLIPGKLVTRCISYSDNTCDWGYSTTEVEPALSNQHVSLPNAVAAINAVYGYEVVEIIDNSYIAVRNESNAN